MRRPLQFALRLASFLIPFVISFALSFGASAAETVRFSRACDSGDQIVVGSVGDVLPHTGLQEQAYASKDGFVSLWHKVNPWIQAADIAYANLEGPAAPGVAKGGKLKADPGPIYNGDVHTGTDFVFNYHPRIIGDLKSSGFDVVSLANNHAMDRSGVGMDRTIDGFNQVGLPYVGARKSNSPRGSWHTLVKTERGGKTWTIAWISCTEHLNGMPDRAGQILLCNRDAQAIEREIQTLFQDRTIDAIVVSPHWGEEYQYKPASSQTSLAKRFLDAGASAIIGSHPHVLQPVSKYKTRDGRETLIAYSLGNFVSGQGRLVGQKLTAILYFGLSRRDGERAWINGISFVPLWMDRRPHSLNMLEASTQAPKKEAWDLMDSLFDPSRRLRAGDAVRTNLECR